MKYTTVKISEILKHPTKRMDAKYWIKKKLKKEKSSKPQAPSLKCGCDIPPLDFNERIQDNKGIMKKYTLAQILEAWSAAYGEDMHEEYPGFIQRLSEEGKK